ncbi:hypothetical protein Tco_1470915, partial [Tanacetum coccineum]
ESSNDGVSLILLFYIGAMLDSIIILWMFDQMLTHLLSIESNIEAAACEFEENIN